MSYRVTFVKGVGSAQAAIETISKVDGGEVEVRHITPTGEVLLSVDELTALAEEESKQEEKDGE